MLLAVLFFTIVLLSLYTNAQNKLATMDENIKKIQDEYKLDDNEAEQLYIKKIEEINEDIEVKFKKVISGTNYVVSEWTNENLTVEINFIAQAEPEKSIVIVSNLDGTNSKQYYYPEFMKNGNNVITHNCKIKVIAKNGTTTTTTKTVNVNQFDIEKPIIVIDSGGEYYVSKNSPVQEMELQIKSVKDAESKGLYSTSGIKNVKYGWRKSSETEPSRYQELTGEVKNYIVTENLGEGTWYFVVEATDKAGNKTTMEQQIDVRVVSLDISPQTANLDVTDNKTLQLSLVGSNYGTVTYKTSNSNVATVNNLGLITAVGNGTCQITATGSRGNPQSTCNVTVQTSPETIAIEPSSAYTNIAITTRQLKVKYTPETTNVNTDITWTSSNISIATINQKGLVTGKSDGITQITAKTKNDKTATCVFVVDKIRPKWAGIALPKPEIDILNPTWKLTLLSTVIPTIVFDETKPIWKGTVNSATPIQTTGAKDDSKPIWKGTVNSAIPIQTTGINDETKPIWNGKLITQ